MDWSSKKGVDHRRRQPVSSPALHLGSIFDNPVALEDHHSSSLSRKKIDCGFEDKLERQIKSLDSWSEESGMRSRGGRGLKEMEYDPTKGNITQTCRRKLCLDELVAPSDSEAQNGATPLLEDCEISSDISSVGEEDFVELKLGSARSFGRSRKKPSTPVAGVCSPVSSRSRSLEELVVEKASPDRVGCLSRADSFHSIPRKGSGDGFFVYPGWSMWGREHSYRSLKSPESPHSISASEASTKCFPGVSRKSLKTSLYQHLVAAAGQRYNQIPVVNRSSSVRTILSSKSSRSWMELRTPSRSSSSTTVSNSESKVPLLKPENNGLKKRGILWSTIKELRSLASRGFSQDRSFTLPSTIIPGCGLSSLDPSLFFKSQKSRVLPEKRRKIQQQQQQLVSSEEPMMMTGYLQSISRHGSVSYSFWMDGAEDQVLVAKPEQQERIISFYTCKATRFKPGFRSGRCSRNRVVNLVATMSFSFYVFTAVDSKGQVKHFMDSECSLLDHSRKQLPNSNKRRNLWRLGSSSNTRCEPSPAAAAVNPKTRKEMAAVVMRVPLEVKKDSQLRPKALVTTTSGFGEFPESCEGIHVVLPRGDHGGVEGPRPLAERWRSGGVCDCGSWDLGCGIITLSQTIKSSEDSDLLNLRVEGLKGEVVGMKLGKWSEEGLYRLKFQKPLVALQAFATAVAVLEGKKGEWRRCLWRLHENETKLPVSIIAPNPPLSPIQRL